MLDVCAAQGGKVVTLASRADGGGWSKLNFPRDARDR